MKLPSKSPLVASEPGEDMCLPLTQGETDANFCCTYFGPRLPPPRLSSLSHRQLLRADLEPPSSHSPHPRSCEMRRTGGLSGRGRSGPKSGGRGPAVALGCELSSGRLQQPQDAAHGAGLWAPPLGCFCPSCSFSACQDCSTLSVLPWQRLSIHLEACDVPPLAGSVTAGAEEREERRSGGCPSAPPAS